MSRRLKYAISNVGILHQQACRARGKLYITLATLRWSISREFSRSTLRQPPQTTCSPYKTEGNIIMNYKFSRTFLLKNELLFKRSSLLTKFFSTSVRWCDQENLSSIVTPKRRMCFAHSIRSSPIVTENSGPMYDFLVSSQRSFALCRVRG